jgi:hypothetical protein
MSAPFLPFLRPTNLLASLFAAGSLAAQTFIVDSANGPGTNFTDLLTAVAAVPSGATLHVRPGSYNGFAVSNKSLTIVGHRVGTGPYPAVNANALFPGIIIGSINAGQSVTLSGLELTAGAVQSAQLSISNCAGAVVLDEITCSFMLPFTMRITNSHNVHASRLLVSAFLPTTDPPPGPPILVQSSSVSFSRLSVQGYRRATSGGSGTAGLSVVQSRVVLVDPVISGGPALVSGAVGGPGLSVSTGSTVHVYGNANTAASRIIGGSATPGAGGHGLELRGGSFARVRGVPLTGGFGTPPGQPSLVDGSSTLEHAPADVAPSALLAGTVQPGNTVRYTLHAKPGSAAVLMIGTQAQLVPVPLLTLGALELDPIITVGAGVVPASQRLEVPSLVPASWPNNLVLLAQFATFHPSPAELSVTNLFTATSRF